MDGSVGSRLTYEVYLKSFERAKESWQLDGEQKVEQARILKDKGTIFFKVLLRLLFEFKSIKQHYKIKPIPKMYIT